MTLYYDSVNFERVIALAMKTLSAKRPASSDEDREAADCLIGAINDCRSALLSIDACIAVLGGLSPSAGLAIVRKSEDD